MKKSSGTSSTLRVTKKLQGNGYYMPGLGETRLMSPQAYFNMERVRKIIVTIDITELIFKDYSIVLV